MFFCLWIVCILLCVIYPDLISIDWSLWLFSFNECLCIIFKIFMLSKITIILTTFVNNTDDVLVNDLAYYFFFFFLFWKGNIYRRTKSVGHDLPMVESLRICSFSSGKTNWDAPLCVLVCLVTQLYHLEWTIQKLWPKKKKMKT